MPNESDKLVAADRLAAEQVPNFEILFTAVHVLIDLSIYCFQLLFLLLIYYLFFRKANFAMRQRENEVRLSR